MKVIVRFFDEFRKQTGEDVDGWMAAITEAKQHADCDYSQ